MTRELAVKILKDILDDYKDHNFSKDQEALKYAINELERTAQEVSVQERLSKIKTNIKTLQVCLTIQSVSFLIILIKLCLIFN